MTHSGLSKRYDVLLRLLLVGNSGVGKTCLICRYAQDEFNENHITTIGVDFKMKTAIVDDKIIRMQIWDSAGQERFEAITKQFYRRAQGVVLVFDICSQRSFESLRKWLHFVKQFSQPNTVVMLLGNKCDRENCRQVPTATALQFAQENNLRYYETSAKLLTNLEEPFLQLCKDILQQEVTEDNSDLHKPVAESTIVDLTKSSVQQIGQQHSQSQMEQGQILSPQQGWCCSFW